MSVYTYSIINDFIGSPGGINKNQLHDEISADGGITKTLETISVKGDVVKIIFDQALTTGEETILNGLVAAHEPMAASPVFINATKIGDGSITNTEFNYLDGITSGVVSLNDTQTLTNKTIDIANNTITGIATYFGTQYNYAEDLTESMTDLTDFQTKLTITTGILPAGLYRVSWSYNWRRSNSAGLFSAQVTVDGVQQYVHRQVGSGNANAANVGAGLFRINLTNAVHVFKLNYRVHTSSSGTSYISGARMEVFRIS